MGEGCAKSLWDAVCPQPGDLGLSVTVEGVGVGQGEVNAVISQGRGLQQTSPRRPDGNTRLPPAGAIKEGPLAAAGPKKEVKVTRVRAKPKGGRRGPGLYGGHLPSDGEQVGWEPMGPGAGRPQHGPAGRWHRL